MSDKNVNIDIRTKADTRGADKAAQSLGTINQSGRAAAGSIAAMEKELGDLEEKLRQLPIDSDEFTTMAAKVKGAQKNLQAMNQQAGQLGRRGNTGMAILEFSRMFEDAQYGVRGMLNNIPLLATSLGLGSGLAGVISIAAVAGTTLWRKMTEGPKDAKNETETLLEAFDKLVKYYDAVADLDKEDRGKKAVDNAKETAKALAGIDRDVKVDVNETNQKASREQMQLRVKMAQSIVDLAKLEMKELHDGQTSALEIAQKRQKISDEIYNTEVKVAEIQRSRDADTARAIAAGAKQKIEELNKASDPDLRSAQELRNKVKFHSDEAQQNLELLTDSKARIKFLEDQIKANQKAWDAAPDTQQGLFQKKHRKLKSELSRESGMATDVEEKFKEQAAQKASAQNQLDALAPKLEEAAARQQEAALTWTQAISNLSTLLQNQKTSIEGDAKTKMANTSGDVASTAQQAIKELEGRDDPATQEAIGRIQGLMKDDTPDGEQGSKIASLLQRLANDMTAKDEKVGGMLGELITLLKGADNKYKNLQSQLDGVKAQMQQGPAQ